MPGFGQVAWFPLCAGLTVLGLIISVAVWRRGGYTKGLRMAAWALVPLAVYLLGVVGLLWRIGLSIAGWALRFVISPTVWAGVVVAGFAVVLFVVSGVLRRRSPKVRAAPSQPAADASDTAKAASVDAGGTEDDDLAEIEELLRRRGIK